MRWSAPFVHDALGMTGQGGPEPSHYTQISTDTRTLESGSLFVALRGERFDGHDHLMAARANGAVAAIVQESTSPLEGLVMYPVRDTLRALGALARAHRRTLRGPVIAVTGTNGKTSTKQMLAAALGVRYRVHATRANLNNLVGVPLTILEAPVGTEALIVEAGANLPGEIGRHREIIEPEISCVTNAVAGHLEGFGGTDGVLREKLQLTEGAPLAVVGIDPPSLAAGARERAHRVLTAGLLSADRMPSSVGLSPAGRACMTVDRFTFTLPVLGLHQAENAMLVWAMAEELGLELADVARALETVELPPGRGELSQHGNLTILNDAYNANPPSFQAIIALAEALKVGRRLVFVAGTMRELGEESAWLHTAIAGQLVRLDPDVLAAVGEFVPALEPYRATLGARLLTASDAGGIAGQVADQLRGDELVVLKASRGVALEHILPLILSRTTPTA